MGLLSPLVLWSAVALAVAVPVATLLLWDRARGPRGVRVASRMVALFACQISAVAALAIAVNDYGYFYGSWSELLGRPVAAPQVFAPAPGRGSSAGASRSLAGLGHSQAVDQTTLERLGRIDHVMVAGARSALQGDAYVWLPPQYFQPGYRHTDFPAAEIFTGYPGNPLMLMKRLRYPEVLAGLVHAHRTAPYILVMIRPAITYPRDTECTDVPGGPPAETFFADDVVSAVASRYRVRAGDWGAMGESTGGWCSAILAFHHPGVFRAAVSMSGYYHPLRDFTTGDLYGGSRQRQEQDDPEWLIGHGMAPAISLLATVGTAEGGPYGYRDWQRLRTLVAAAPASSKLALTAVAIPHGGHNIQTWQAQLPDDLTWLGQRLAAG